MTWIAPTSVADTDRKVAELIATLHETEQRLEQLTAGEVDAITDRHGRTFMLRHAQEQLRRDEATTQASILNALPAHIALIDAQGLIISVNEAWRRFSGPNAIQASGWAVGVDYLEICDKARGVDAARARQAAAGIRAVLHDEAPSFELEYPCHSARKQRWFLMTVTPLGRGPGHGVVVMHVDVTLKRQTEQSLRVADVSLAEQASLLDQAHDAIIVRGIDARIRFWNKGAERMFGWTAGEAIGTSMETLLCADTACLHPAIEGVMAAGDWSGDLRQRCKDGSVVTVAAHFTLVRDDAGRPKAILCINTDITRRLAMEQQLQQSQRLEAVGQLTGGVAHDFNNLLTVILGNAEVLAERLIYNKRLHTLADMIRTAAQRGADLTNRLLAFARRQTLEPKAVNANELLAGMEGLLRRTLREDIELALVAGSGLWPALVDPAQLEGAVLNLCINARDAMAAGGKLLVETANVPLDEEFAARHPGVKPGDYVMVTVSDTGAGISAENLTRVFEPFFTTKEFGKGTGLGLSMVYGFVKQSAGHISLYSEVGHGTTVKMFLPRAEPGTATLAEASPALTPIGGSETVLLAEDDDMVRRYAQAQLVELGYRVVPVRNGAEALEAIREQGDIDLLFTDVVMPGGLNGPELAEAALKLRPALKLLFTSGYTDNALVQQGRFGRGIQLLSKPYRRIELAQKLRVALGETPA